MQMTKIVRTTADLFFPFCLVFGLYVVAHGHLTPGGGFQGGAVMATGTALILVARSYGDATGRIRKGAMKVCEAAGLLIFLCAGFGGILADRPFMANWIAPGAALFPTSIPHGTNPGDLNSGGLLPLLNLGVGIEVLGGLTVILLYMLSGIREDKRP